MWRFARRDRADARDQASIRSAAHAQPRPFCRRYLAMAHEMQPLTPHLTQIDPPRPSSFDAHHAPEKALLADCVHCGFCLPACPTYVLWGEEMDSPRGRIYMMQKASEGAAPLDGNFRMHMDNCLGCMACVTACPSGVQYDKL